MSYHFLSACFLHKTRRFFSGRGRRSAAFFFVIASMLGGTTSVYAVSSVQGGDIHHEDDLISSSRTISLGTGEFAGDFSYSYPLTLPSGRNGLQPALSLAYSSNNADISSPIGYGWSVSVPYIERINKEGVENLYNKTYFYSSLDGELASTTSSTYGPKIENGSFRKYEMSTSTSGWTVTDKSGTIYTFGSSASTRMDDPNNAYKVYRWYLQEVRDTNDNYISYTYFKNNGQVYIATSTYTGYDTTDGPLKVEFYHELRNDVASSSEFGFWVGSRYRINEIRTTIDGSWVRKYALAYTTGDNGIRSLLDTITETGKDESGTETALPAINFNYQGTKGSWTRNAAWENAGLDCLYCGGEYFGHLTGDVNGDGLADIVKRRYEDTAAYLFINKGDNTGWYEWHQSPVATTSIPITADSNGNDWGTRLIDVNGDGYADFLYGHGSTTAAYINNGDNSGWTENTTWAPPYYFVDEELSDTGLRIAELNGDGLPDLLVSNTVPFSKVYINNGHGWSEDSGWSIPFNFVDWNGADFGVRVLDVNGDGLSDIVRASEDDANPDSVYLNTGRKGWAENTNWVLPESFITSDGEAYGVRLLDINGDNLVDFIRSDGQSGTYTKVYLNDGDGTGWTQDASWSIPEQFVDSLGVDQGTRIEDVNGDGLADFVRSNDLKRVYLHNGKKSDILSKIIHSEGGRTIVNYKPAQQYTSDGKVMNPYLPFVAYTVETTEFHDGISATTSTKTYNYSGGDLYYGFARDHRFAGFGTTTVIDGLGNVTNNFFHQGNATNSAKGEYADDNSKIGKPYRVEKYDNVNHLYSKTINKWGNVDLGYKRDFTKLTRTTDFAYDGDADHAEKSEEYSYSDSNGNLAERTEWGQVIGSDDGSFTDMGSDKFITSISYAASSTPYVVGLPSQQITKDSSTTTVKDIKFYYDDLANGSVDKGNETKRELWKSGSSYASTTNAYNSYGLVTESTDALGHETTFTYDARNLYVATSTNPLGHVTGYAYDYSNGKPKRVQNPNGFIFETVFDGLDRVTAEKQPDLTTPTTRVTKASYAYTDSQPRSVEETHNLDGSTSFLVYKYFDGFNRIIQERKEAEDSWYAVKDYGYDPNGLLQTESLPYFSSGTAKTSATSTPALFTTYTYDPLQRVHTVINAAGETIYEYDDWTTTITDAESNTKDLTQDAYNRLLYVNEHNSGATATTTYGYNYLGNLTKITDAESNVRNFTYDGIGWRLTAEDLHDTGDATYGSWTYTYDDAGNLISQIDPDSKTVTFTYDDANRVLTENYTGSAGTEITFAYDICSNGKGFLCGATTTIASTHYGYNALGGTASEIKTISNTDYTTGFKYDRQSNQTKVIYPDSAEAIYTYNTAGLLETVSRRESGGATTTVMSDFDYAPTGQVAFQKYANGVESTRAYDKTNLYRLQQLLTELPGGMGGAGLEDPGYFIEDLNQSFTLPDSAETKEPAIGVPEFFEEFAPTTEDTATTTDTIISPPVEDSILPTEEEFTEDVLSEEAPVTSTSTVETTEIATDEPTIHNVVLAGKAGADIALLLSESNHERGYSETVEPFVITSENADVLAKLGISVSSVDAEQKDVPLPRELQKELETRTWNRSSTPLEARVVQRELWASNGTNAKIIPTKFESEFRNKWKNYLSEDGWKPIDTAIKLASDKSAFVMTEAPFEALFPLRSTGTAAIYNNNRWDIFQEKEITTEPLTMRITAVDTADVSGRIVTGDLYTPTGLHKNITYVLYENAYPEGDLIYYVDNGRAPRLSKLIRIHSNPTRLSYAFDVSITGAGYTVSNEENTIKIQASENRGFGFKKFQLWDSSIRGGLDTDNTEEINVTFEETAPNEYRLTKILPESYFVSNPVYPVYTDTTSTFYPDPNTESTSVDGYVWRSGVNQSWADIHDATSGTSASDSASALNVSLVAHASNQDAWAQMGRGFILFDTSSIPDTDDVTSATFSIDGDGGTDTHFNQSGCVVGSTPASDTSLTIGDYDQLGTTAYADCFDLGSWSTSSYNDITFNATGQAAVAKTGITKLGWRLSSDRENSMPTWAASGVADASPHSADVAGTSVDPKLVVVHGVPNQAPSVPIGLQVEGETNPTTVTDSTPDFSAIYNDPDEGDFGTWYRIQVSSSTADSWLHVTWDSGTSTMATTTESNRSPNLSYTGSSLASSTAYYWRIRFSDDDRKTGAWSTATSTFSLAQTAPVSPASGGIQNLTYTYDAVGNIIQIIDVSDTDTKKTMNYAYDNLYRLKSATSTNATTTQSNYTQTYSYSSIGNLTNKSDVGTYAYAETNYANPHAATSINGATQTYSNSGNLLSNGTWNYRYNHRGELTRATTTTALSNFGYDHTGQRIFLKEGSQATTTFANKLYSIQGATTTKHIFAAGQLVATIENTTGGGGGTPGDSGFKTTGTVEVNTGWGNMTTTRINTSDNSDAACSATCDNSDDAQMSDFSFGIPSGATINGIQVVTEMAEGASADNILVDFSLSWNDGSSFTSVKTATVDGTTDTDYTVGGSSDTWGRTWTDTELANGTFRLRLDKNPSVDNLFVDYLRVKVSYTTGGGTSTTTTAYIHTDHLSGTSAITNDHRDIIQVLDYYPYGSIRVNTKEPTAHFDEKRKFTGYEYDSSTGLNYAGARYQSPSEGRFTGQDPAFINTSMLNAQLTDPQSWNSYAYARNNPLILVDRDGQWFETAFDIAMLGLSINDFRQNPTIGNALGVGADALSVALPIPALVGGIRHANKFAGMSDEAVAFLTKGEKNTSVYAGINQNGIDDYTGISTDVSRRASQHGDRFSSVKKITGDPVTRGQARAIEQARIVNNQGQNVRNSISPQHVYYQEVLAWAQKQLAEIQKAVDSLNKTQK